MNKVRKRKIKYYHMKSAGVKDWWKNLSEARKLKKPWNSLTECERYRLFACSTYGEYLHKFVVDLKNYTGSDVCPNPGDFAQPHQGSEFTDDERDCRWWWDDMEGWCMDNLLNPDEPYAFATICGTEIEEGLQPWRKECNEHYMTKDYQIKKRNKNEKRTNQVAKSTK